MFRVMASMLSFAVPEFGINGRAVTRSGNRPETRFVNVYRASDGYVFVAPITNMMWSALMEILETPQWSEAGIVDEGLHFKDPEIRALIDKRLESWIMERSTSEAVAIFQKRRIASALFLGVEELFRDSGLGPWTVRLRSTSGWEGLAAAGSFGDCGVESDRRVCAIAGRAQP